jgi:hypothetical protein
MVKLSPVGVISGYSVILTERGRPPTSKDVLLTEITGSLINSSPVGGLFTYSDLIIADSGDDITVKAICGDGGDFLQMDSVTLNVHDWPKNGLAKKTSIAFSYTGEAQYVADIFTAFQAVLAEANSTAPARRRRFADASLTFNMKEEL